MTIALSFGKWGGIYWSHLWTWRLCLGWVAITVFPMDIDELLLLMGGDL